MTKFFNKLFLHFCGKFFYAKILALWVSNTMQKFRKNQIQQSNLTIQFHKNIWTSMWMEGWMDAWTDSF